jgi:hypothetical protein
MQSHPDFRIMTKMHPLDFDFGAEGGLEFMLGSIIARADPIPVTLTIPFLRRRRQAIGSIGPFGVRLEPVKGTVRTDKFRVGGTLGKEGLGCRMEGDMACETECDVTGTIPGKTGRISFEMGDDRGRDPHHHHRHEHHDHDHHDDHHDHDHHDDHDDHHDGGHHGGPDGGSGKPGRRGD